MTNDTEPKTNVDRLLEFLEDNSLAARLIKAHRDRPRGASSATAMTEMVQVRLKELRDEHEHL